jgi:GT2 family glycosyltransferase
MQISIIICSTGKRIKELNNLLHSIYKQNIEPYEIIFIFQGNIEKLKIINLINSVSNTYHKSSIKIKYYFYQHKSLAWGKNIGGKLADGNSDWLLFLDDDVELMNDFIKKLIDGAKRYEGAKILFGRIENLKESNYIYNIFARIFKLPIHKLNSGFKVLKSFKTTYDVNCDNDKIADWASGGASLVKKHLIKEFKYDDNLILYSFNEDLDFSYRVSKKYKNSIWYISNARLIHHEANLGRLNRDNLSIMKTLYDYYLFHKNKKLDLNYGSYLISELALLFATAIAEIIRFQAPYSFFGLLKSYYYLIKYNKDLKRGDLKRVNSMLLQLNNQV